ncbi:MAG: TIGR01440 family protein [Eubacteriales bacterium]|nr:TIGR01440 family protein [Eubacteriales bacterium]
MSVDQATIFRQATEAAKEVIEAAQHTLPGDFFVLGCSTSEIQGGVIGKASSEETGRTVTKAIMAVCREHGLELAVQGCEHINRALTVERSAMLVHNLEEVNVLPQLHAGGAASVAAWELFQDPVCVEHITASLGLDIGDTEIGMHIRHVQKPVRPTTKQVGAARVTALVYRPKLVGGSRAEHQV